MLSLSNSRFGYAARDLQLLRLLQRSRVRELRASLPAIASLRRRQTDEGNRSLAHVVYNRSSSRVPLSLVRSFQLALSFEPRQFLVCHILAG